MPWPAFIKDQCSFHTLKQLENLLLKAARKEDYSEELKYVVDFYHDDFNESSLSLHLELLSTAIEPKEGPLCLDDTTLFGQFI